MEARLADPTFSHPPIDPARCIVDVYNLGVFRYEGLYIGFPAMFHRTGRTGFHLVQLVCSRDLKTWKRLGDRKTFIGPSRLGSGAYDLTQIIGPSRAVERGDELWFYYTALKYRSVPKDPDPDTGAICLYSYYGRLTDVSEIWAEYSDQSVRSALAIRRSLDDQVMRCDNKAPVADSKSGTDD